MIGPKCGGGVGAGEEPEAYGAGLPWISGCFGQSGNSSENRHVGRPREPALNEAARAFGIFTVGRL